MTNHYMKKNMDILNNVIEIAIKVRDERCKTLEEKDAIADLINITENILNFLKERRN